jgi:hypothetical protein
MKNAQIYNDPFYFEAKKEYDRLVSMASKSKQEQYLHDNYLFR